MNIVMSAWFYVMNYAKQKAGQAVR